MIRYITTRPRPPAWDPVLKKIWGVATPQSTPGLTLLFPFTIAYPNRLLNAQSNYCHISDGKSNPPSLLSNLLMCVMTAGVCAKNFITLGFWTFLQSGQSFFFRFTAWLV